MKNRSRSQVLISPPPPSDENELKYAQNAPLVGQFLGKKWYTKSLHLLVWSSFFVWFGLLGWFFNILPFYLMMLLSYVLILVVSFLRCRRLSCTKLFYGLLACLLLLLTCLVAFATVQVFHTRFSPKLQLQVHKLGGTTDSTIAIWLRAPGSSHVQVQYKPNTQSIWTDSPYVGVDPIKDFTAIVQLRNLSSSTTYDYRILYKSVNGKISEPSKMWHFNTFPKAGSSSRFRFLSTSCTMKAQTWNYKFYGMRHALKKKPLFSIFSGDLIYTDVPLLFVGEGENVNNYYAKYRETFDDPDFKEFSASIPTYYMYDDHEIINDYNKGKQTSLYKASVSAWQIYAGSTNPAVYSNEEYFHFNVGQSSFFVFDTRGYLRPKSTRIGDTQLSRLKDWILSVNQTSTFKFLVSGTPWTRNYGHGDEGWSKTLTERDAILDFIEENNVKGCIFLSGDAHILHVAKLRKNIIEISASPLSASGPPTSTFKYSHDESLFNQPEISLSRGNQYAILEVDTIAEVPVVTATLYSSIGDNEDLWFKISIYSNGTYFIFS